LCQTGAAAMAAAGADFRAILDHYYPNTVLAPER
jgi:peptidoglycan hydrolase-like amidase